MALISWPGNDYLKWLDKWKENIEMGMTTWAEISEIDNARSDCHAWGSSPNIEFSNVLVFTMFRVLRRKISRIW
jgi:hypothetical protein